MPRWPSLTHAICALALLSGCGRSPQSPIHEQIYVADELPTLQPGAGRTVIDFEDQPGHGSSMCVPGEPTCSPIANPLIIDGVSFASPVSLETGFCSAPTCQPDPDNPSHGNITLALNPGGTIAFPDHTRGALLVVEGIGENPFRIRVTDMLGNTKDIERTGVMYGTRLVGFWSPNDIERVELLDVGGTHGPLALSAVVVLHI